VRQRCREVVVVLRPRVLRLVEQHDLRTAVGDPVGRAIDHAVVGQADARVATANPGVAVGRLAEDVEAPHAGVRVAHPCLVRRLEQVMCLRERPHDSGVRADDEDLEVAQRGNDLHEARSRNRDLEVLVLPPLAAEEQVDRPPGRDIPRHVDVGEERRHALRAPGIPFVGVVVNHVDAARATRRAVDSRTIEL
jgi:hypothetical protein